MQNADQWRDIRKSLQESRPHLSESGTSSPMQATRPKSGADEKTFLQLIGKLKKILLAVAFFSLVINLLMLVGPIYMMQVYDRVLSSGSLPTLFFLTLAAVALIAVSAMLEGARSRILVRLGGKMDKTLSRELFVRLIEKVPGSGKECSLRDLDTVRGFLTGSGLFFFFDAPWTPIFLAVLFFLHPVLFAVAVSGALALFSIAIVTEFLTRKPLGQAANHLGSASQFASEVQASTSTVEAMGMTHGLCERWQSQSQKGLAQQAKASDRAGILTATTKFIRPVLQVAILGVGAFLVLNLEISAGAMIASSIIMGRALAPVEGAIGNWRSFVLARSAYGRISDTLHSPGRVYSSLPLPKPEGHVSVENVIAGPPGSDTPVIKGITFALPAGEALGVVGPSAAGKSTLARLLLGVWPTEKGCVRLDGADVAGWNRAELGPHIGYLSQSIELFDGTIAENIARFDTNAPSEAIIAAAKEAGVHEMILRQPDGYSTRIGRGGLVLSGGQRQRIGLARALYGNPSFIILDEPNSNLDAQGEIALAHAMRNLKKRGATVVVITHRRSILDNVDKVLVLRDGAVEHFGSSEDVMNALSRSARQNYAAQVEQSKDRQSDDASSGVTALASRSG